MIESSRICVLGHRGLVGSAITRRLEQEGFANMLLVDRADLDLTDQRATRAWFNDHRPDFVFLAAAKVGGIVANSTYPAEFIRDNLLIQTNVIDSAQRFGAQKLLFLGSSCIYPKQAPQPMKEDHLLTGPLETTNEWYAVAKISGLKMIQAYRRQHGFCGISLMPTNLYGPGDNFDLQTSHVLPALLRKFHQAKIAKRSEVVVWGRGKALREFLHVDDLAGAALFLMREYDDEQIINVGQGEEISIADLACLIQGIVGHEGKIVFDESKPDGSPRKLLDTSRLHALGWRAKIGLRAGIEHTYAWYMRNAGEHG